MTVTLVLALLLQLIAVLLLRVRLGKTWLQRPVTLLVLASVVYDGLSPTLMAFPSIGRWDIYRQGVHQSWINEATLIMSAGMLAFTLCYFLTHPERATAAPAPEDIRAAARVLDWRLLALACAPLAVLTYEGRGYNNGSKPIGAGAPLSSDLASTFLVTLVVLAAFSLILRRGAGWFLPVLAVQSLLLAAAGERTPVVVDAIALIVLLAHAGRRPARRQLGAAVGLTVLAVLAITGVRAEQGRAIYYRDSGLTARAVALGSGIAAAGTTSQGGPGLAAQAAVRLDGTDFAGAILQAEHLGQPRLSAGYVPESLLLAVPSAAWPSKLAHGDALNPPLLEADAFGLQQVNFLPGLAGLYAGFLTPAWLVIFLAVLGALAGRGERLLLRSRSPAALVMLAGAAIAALDYEEGLPGMLVNLRAAAVGAAVIMLAGFARRHWLAQATRADAG